MMFLKLTQRAKGFLKRSGWLLAELVFVFVGMYGAFLLERMHEENLDDLRERQILQALIDEFGDYEKELSDFKEWLDEGYANAFFQSYSRGEKPFPPIIPSGGMGKVNTGIWEAMLQSGGIELLEMEMILEIQSFFKKLQDVLDLYSRFERLTETMILPESDRNASFFYEEEGIVLRNKYKWYVNSLFSLGISLGEMSDQAGTTKTLLIGEFKKNFPDYKIKTEDSKQTSAEEDPPIVEEEEQEVISEVADLPAVRVKDPELERAVLSHLLNLLSETHEDLSILQAAFDERFAIPFFTAYTEGEKPVPMPILLDHNLSDHSMEWRKFFDSQEVRNLDLDIIGKTDRLFSGLDETVAELDKFSKLTDKLLPSAPDGNFSKFYAPDQVELRESFTWFPNQMFSIGNGLGALSENLDSLRNEVSDRYSTLSGKGSTESNSSTDAEELK